MPRAVLVAGFALIAGSALAAQPVRAASPNVDLDQWAPLAGAWQNGNLNGNNARFPEGGAVPFRLAIEGLTAGIHQIHINYDFTAGGHKAYDFLTTWNAWLGPSLCAPSGGAISSLCPSLPAPSTGSFTADPFAADGLTVSAAQVYSGAPRRLTIFGGTILSIGPVVHSGPVAGNSTADILVRFRSTGSAVLLAWAGHLAQSAFWNLAAGGTRDGAGEVSGAPWHMRTLQLDGAGNKNQDRSIQPSAIVGELPPLGLAPPTPVPTATPRSSVPTPRSSVPTPTPGSPGAPSDPQAPVLPPGVVPTPPPTATDAPARPGSASWPAVVVAVLAAGALMAVAALGGGASRRRSTGSR